jgi:hypothetical protein
MLWVNIDLGDQFWITQKVRLQGVNAPELDTPESIAAKDYSLTQMNGCSFIAVKTYWLIFSMMSRRWICFASFKTAPFLIKHC